MKNIMILFLLMFSFYSLCSGQNYLYVPCDAELAEYAKNFVRDDDDVTYLKHFAISLDKQSNDSIEVFSKFSLVLAKGVKYRLYIFDSKNYLGESVFELHDDEIKLGTSYVEKLNKNFPFSDFKCIKTGVYHMVVRPLENEALCSVAVLGYVENFDETISPLKEVDENKTQ